MRYYSFYTAVGLIALVALVLTGCSGTQQAQYNSPADAFQQGVENYEDGEYEDAIQYFQAVLNYGRTVEHADDAHFYLGRAYQADGQYQMAATEYGRFIELYPNDARAPDAEFHRAASFYELSPPYELDQTNTERAISAFQLFMERHPTHERVPEAEEKVTELREKLARKRYNAGELYERRDMYRAAALEYERVFDQYPDTPLADDALLAAIRSYIEYADMSVEERREERYQQAVSHYERLTQVFPNSPLISEAEELHEEAQERLEEIEQQLADRDE